MFVIPASTGNVLLEKSIKVFSKPSGLKYNLHCQRYIHFSNRRHTKKITPAREKVMILQKLVRRFFFIK